MICEELAKRIENAVGFVPTKEQKEAIDYFSRFFYSRNQYSTMIIRGCAGTGKTTVAAAIVKVMKQLSQNVCLLAPTGRAAKVFSLYSGNEAFTIHRKIYKQKSLDTAEPEFTLNFNKSKHTLFIIDESSMISCQNSETSLLDDLIEYVYEIGNNCRILFMGDQAQLPPVGKVESPALSARVLEDYGLEVTECDMKEVLRQSRESGILFNATKIRESLQAELPKIKFQGFADIQTVSGNDLIDILSQSYRDVGIDETMIVTRSNKRANIYNEGIRRTILDRDGQLCGGDIIMVVKNNYFWTEQDPDTKLSFIANGDRALVKRIRNIHELYGFTFADVTIDFPDYDEYEITLRVILDALSSEAPALTREQSDLLYEKVLEDYCLQPNRPSKKRELYAQVKNDSYFNALQVKYAYAVTCHKAQGGQWQHVYIDQGYLTEDMMNEDYFHWLYTAFTRASKKLFLINWPTNQIEA